MASSASAGARLCLPRLLPRYLSPPASQPSKNQAVCWTGRVGLYMANLLIGIQPSAANPPGLAPFSRCCMCSAPPCSRVVLATCYGAPGGKPCRARHYEDPGHRQTATANKTCQAGRPSNRIVPPFVEPPPWVSGSRIDVVVRQIGMLHQTAAEIVSFLFPCFYERP